MSLRSEKTYTFKNFSEFSVYSQKIIMMIKSLFIFIIYGYHAILGKDIKDYENTIIKFV